MRMKYQALGRSIKYWAEEERPREKLFLLGAHHLSDAELLAILIGSGTRQLSAVDLARELLRSNDNKLDKLGRCRPADLMKHKGIGRAKAVAIAAALELGRRRQLQPLEARPVVKSSQQAHRLLAPLMQDLDREVFYALALSRSCRLISRVPVSEGGLDATVVDPRVLFRKALDLGAHYLILGHNHPSGTRRASESDIQLTRKIKKAGELLDIFILDHLIITRDGYYSFADEGML